MPNSLPDISVYLVTDPKLAKTRSVEDVCLLALEAGVRIVQLRDKSASTRVLVQQAIEIRKLVERFDAKLLINDRVDVAMASGAHGVHLGQDDLTAKDARRLLGPNKIVGVSVRTSAEAQAAQMDSADYLAANLVFATATKTDIDQPLGLEGIRQLTPASALPLIAIGGIDDSNAEQVCKAGADGVAVVSAIMAADDVSAACQALFVAVKRGRSDR